MDPDRWRRVEEVFHRALEVDAASRAAFLAEACRGDDGLRSEVERLIGEDERPHALVDRLEEGALLPTEDPLIGREIGPYRLTALIGFGGMGVVYRAERTDGLFDRDVAIKLIRVELAGANLVRRFEVERRTLAALQHPNVAQLLDGGTTADGRPYLVMELVRGVPIDLYCDEKRLTVEERLRLFVQVCAGVHYAHQNLVVHRDLKPGNVLVDEAGTPKLLDFGIARLLDETATRGDSLTLTGAPIVTPDYASPEQLLLGPVTTAMDVYALGVVLYELLVGRRPFESENLPPVDWQLAVIERSPTRPSAIPDASEEVAACRRSTPRGLARRVSGDLDRIVLMALRKEPERRYGSVKELADDVEAHLAGLPVRARPDSVVYRATKFVRRNRLAVGLAAAVLVSLLVGIVVSRRAEQRARTQALHARIEADSFQRNGEFLLEDLLASTDPSDAAALARERAVILEHAERVRREQSGESHLRANLLDSLGRVAQRLGAFDDAEKLIREALAIRERSFGASNLETALSLKSLGLFHLARGEPVPAAEILARALELHREHAQETHTDVASIANDLASALRPLGRLDEAEGLAREALGIRRAAGDGSLAVSESLELLGAIARDRGDLAGAGARFEEALSIRRRIVGSAHALALESMCDWASILAMEGNGVASTALFDEAEKGARNLRFAGLDVLARVLVARAATDGVTTRGAPYERKGGRRRIDEALALQVARLGPDHPEVATVLALGAQSSDDWERVLAIRRRPGASPWLLGLSLLEAGTSMASFGTPVEVRAALAESVALLSAPGVTPTPALGGGSGRVPRSAPARRQLADDEHPVGIRYQVNSSSIAGGTPRVQRRRRTRKTGRGTVSLVREEGVELGAERDLLRRLPPAEEARARDAGERERAPFPSQDPAFAQAEHGHRVLLVELRDPFLARLPHVLRRGIGVDVVRVQLERQHAERGERRRLDDRHVVRRADRRAGEVRAGAPADVGHAGLDARAHRVEDAQRVHLREQPERVPAADEEGLRARHGRARRPSPRAASRARARSHEAARALSSRTRRGP
jgi:serine/threonine-protein kinase